MSNPFAEPGIAELKERLAAAEKVVEAAENLRQFFGWDRAHMATLPKALFSVAYPLVDSLAAYDKAKEER